jgi:hypothetical protein
MMLCTRYGMLLAARELWKMAGRQGAAQKMEEYGGFTYDPL